LEHTPSLLLSYHSSMQASSYPNVRNRRPGAASRDVPQNKSGESDSDLILSESNMDKPGQQQGATYRKQLSAGKRTDGNACIDFCIIFFFLLVSFLLSMTVPRSSSDNAGTNNTNTNTNTDKDTDTAWCHPVNLTVTHHRAGVIGTPSQLIDMTRSWTLAADTVASLQSDQNQTWSALYTPDVAALCSALLTTTVNLEDANTSKHVAHVCASIEFHLASADKTFAVLAPAVKQWPRTASGYMQDLQRRADEIAAQLSSSSSSSLSGEEGLFFSPRHFRGGHQKQHDENISITRRFVEGPPLMRDTTAYFPTANIWDLDYSSCLMPAEPVNKHAVSLRSQLAQSIYPWRFSHLSGQQQQSMMHDLGGDVSLVPLAAEYWPAPSSSTSSFLGDGMVAAVERNMRAQIRQRQAESRHAKNIHHGSGTLVGLFYSLALVSDGIDELLILSQSLLSSSWSHQNMFERNVALQKQTTAILGALLSLRSIQHQADTLHRSLSHLSNFRSDERMGWVSLKVTSPVVANSVFAKVTH